MNIYTRQFHVLGASTPTAIDLLFEVLHSLFQVHNVLDTNFHLIGSSNSFIFIFIYFLHWIIPLPILTIEMRQSLAPPG